jgi:hypothetical protein
MILNLDKLQKDSTPYDNFLICSIIVTWILHDFTIFYRIVPYSTIFYHILPTSQSLLACYNTVLYVASELMRPSSTHASPMIGRNGSVAPAGAEQDEADLVYHGISMVHGS